MKIQYLIFFILSGCTTYTEYDPHNLGEDVARVRLISALRSTHVYRVLEGDCRNLEHYAFLGKKQHNGTLPENSLGMPWIEGFKEHLGKDQYIEVLVPSDEQVTIYFSASELRREIHSTFRIRAEANKDYDLFLDLFTIHGHELSKSGTYINVLEITEAEDQCGKTM